MARRSILNAIAWYWRPLLAANLVIAQTASGLDASNIDRLITKGEYAEAFRVLKRQGLTVAEKSSAKSRSLSLGYLALAESYLHSGDFTKSHEYGMKGLQLTLDLFGPKHQDVVDALDTLALAEMKTGKPRVAEATARKALTVATELFGEASPGTLRPVRTLQEVTASIEPGSPR